MTEMGNIDIYDIYVDVCNSQRVANVVGQLAKAGSRLHKALHNRVNLPYEPCEDTFTQEYLNQDNVQKAIHASIPYEWQDCSPRVIYDYSDVEKSVLPVYKDLFASKSVNILVYSGDVDAIVPYPGTRMWVAQLKREVLHPWRPWMVDQQVGGYVTVYDGMTFATVRQAGHMVPETQPHRAFEMFRRFIQGSIL